MFKTTLIAAASLLAVTFAGAETTAAKVVIDIHIGGGGGGHPISCARGAQIVWNHGYGNVHTIDCFGKFYRYTGRRGFKKFIIKVKSTNGAIVDVQRIF